MNQVTKTEKAGESSNTVGPPGSLQSMSQDSTHDQILDITSEIEPLESDILPDSQKHYLKGSLTFYRSSQIPLEDKDKDKSDSASSGKALSHLHFVCKTGDSDQFCFLLFQGHLGTM